VLLRLSVSETDLEALLPDRWGASHPEHVLEHRLDESRRRAARQQEKRQQRRAFSSRGDGGSGRLDSHGKARDAGG
jgi:hypothetical protein